MFYRLGFKQLSMMKPYFLACFFMLSLGSSMVSAADGGIPSSWSLIDEYSKITYGSIKNDSIGESNYFKSLSGTIDRDGGVSIDIDLSSVETNIGIRNQRMIRHVFGGVTSANLATILDIEVLDSLNAGDVATIDVEGVLTFLGSEIPVETRMVMARLGNSRLMVVTDEMIMMTSNNLGIDSGISKMMEIAQLSSVTEVIPVSMRLVFEGK